MSLRRPGARWRLLVHEMYRGETVGSHYVEPNPDRRPDDTTYRTHHELPSNTEFDELVVGRWLHIEQMDATTWWMNIGGVTVHVTADRDGRPKRVTVHGPLDYDAPVDGCTYEEYWTDRKEGEDDQS